MGKSIIIIEKERLMREWSSQEKCGRKCKVDLFLKANTELIQSPAPKSKQEKDYLEFED